MGVVRRVVMLVGLMAVGAGVLVACVPPSSITGTIRGPGGVLVGGATVTAHDIATHAPVLSDVTEADGVYALAKLPPGTYKVEVVPAADAGLVGQWYSQAAGFESAAPLVVTADAITYADVTLVAPTPAPIALPLGGEGNHLGTGDLGRGASGSAYERENVWLAINGRCTDKAQGDRIASAFANGTPTNSPANSCTGSTNPEYRDDNYVIGVDLPTDRTYDTDVLIYNGTYSIDRYCSMSATANRTMEGCPGTTGGITAPMTTTFSLYGADLTPGDDADNAKVDASQCNGAGAPAGATGEKSFAPRTDYTAETNTTFNPDPTQFVNTAADGTSVRSGWWNLCRLPASVPAGRYFIRVRNQSSSVGSGVVEATSGSNAFSVVASRAQQPGLCNVRDDATCPRVSASTHLSVYARIEGTTSFPLAELSAARSGQRVRLELWDVAEGATSLRVLRPNGCAAWTPQVFDWHDDGSSGETVATQIPVSSYAFNARLVTIEFVLPPDWDPAPCNQWFWLQYTHGTQANDRSTWSLAIVP